MNSNQNKSWPRAQCLPTTRPRWLPHRGFRCRAASDGLCRCHPTCLSDGDCFCSRYSEMEGGKVRKKLVDEKTGPMSSRGSKRIFYPPCSIFFCCQHKLTDRHALMRGGKSLNLQSISLLKSMIIWIFFRLDNYVSWGIQVCECSTGQLDLASFELDRPGRCVWPRCRRPRVLLLFPHQTRLQLAQKISAENWTFTFSSLKISNILKIFTWRSECLSSCQADRGPTSLPGSTGTAPSAPCSGRSW